MRNTKEGDDICLAYKPIRQLQEKKRLEKTDYNPIYEKWSIPKDWLNALQGQEALEED